MTTRGNVLAADGMAGGHGSAGPSGAVDLHPSGRAALDKVVGRARNRRTDLLIRPQ
jgi:hypothetical protein